MHHFFQAVDAMNSDLQRMTPKCFIVAGLESTASLWLLLFGDLLEPVVCQSVSHFSIQNKLASH